MQILLSFDYVNAFRSPLVFYCSKSAYRRQSLR